MFTPLLRGAFYQKSGGKDKKSGTGVLKEAMNFRRNTPPGRFAELTLGKVGIFAELLYIDFSADLTGKSWDFGGMNVHAGLNFYFLPTAGMKAPLPVRFRPEFSRSSGSE